MAKTKSKKIDENIFDGLDEAAKKSVKDNPVNKILKKKIETFEEFIEKWDKFTDYIKPFVDQNEEMSKLMSNLRMNILMFPIEDMILMTAVCAERLCMPKMFCLKCSKEIEKNDNT